MSDNIEAEKRSKRDNRLDTGDADNENLRMSTDALSCLQFAAECFLVDLFSAWTSWPGTESVQQWWCKICVLSRKDSVLQSYNDKKQKGFCEKERGCVGDVKICISPQFWTSDEREVTKGSLGNVKNSHFTTVLRPTSTKWREGCLPPVSTKPTRRKKKKETAQPFSAAILSYHVAVVRGWLSAILIRLLWSGVGGQPFSSSCCGQGLVVSYSHHVAVVRGWWCGQQLSHHVAVVRGWWSAILIMLLWSEVGGQLLSHHVAAVRGWSSAIVTWCCCGQGLVVSYCHIMLLWSGAGGQLLARSLEGPFPGAFGKNNFCPEWVPWHGDSWHQK